MALGCVYERPTHACSGSLHPGMLSSPQGKTPTAQVLIAQRPLTGLAASGTADIGL